MAQELELEQAQADIARSRAELAATADDLQDRLSPRRAADRQKARVRNRLGAVRESVMGLPTQAAHQVKSASGQLADSTGGAGEQLTQLPTTARTKARGNPIAAGVVAFGAGFLLGSIGPATSTEREAAESLTSNLGPVREHVQSSATEFASGMKESAQGAAQRLQETGTQVAHDVAEQGRDAARDVAETGKSAASS